MVNYSNYILFPSEGFVQWFAYIDVDFLTGLCCCQLYGFFSRLCNHNFCSLASFTVLNWFLYGFFDVVHIETSLRSIWPHISLPCSWTIFCPIFYKFIHIIYLAIPTCISWDLRFHGNPGILSTKQKVHDLWISTICFMVLSGVKAWRCKFRKWDEQPFNYLLHAIYVLFSPYFLRCLLLSI